jgi:hypothetical protein
VKPPPPPHVTILETMLERVEGSADVARVMQGYDAEQGSEEIESQI